MKFAETPTDTDIPTPEELFSSSYKVPEVPEVASAKDIITAPPLDDCDDSEETAIVPQGGRLLTLVDPEDKEKNIDRAVRTLRSVAADASAKTTDRIAASKVLLEASGALGKGTNVNIIKSDNTQINQNPEISEHLLKAFRNIGAVAGASDAGIRTHTGGKGI